MGEFLDAVRHHAFMQNALLAGLLVVAAGFEELVKSAGIVVLNEHGHIKSTRQVFILTFLSALGFLIGEKLLLLVSVSVVSESALSAALFNTGALIVPLLAHFVFTSTVCLLRSQLRVRYLVAFVAGAALHIAYNAIIAGGIG